MPFDVLASSLTLTGSVLSCLGSGCIIICFAVYHSTQRSFRHVLVFSLAVSDFINSLNNSISGSIYLGTHELRAGAACTFNGWVGQLSVQATDFSILAIGVATLLVVRRQTRLDSISKTRRALLCLAVWTMPLVSSTTVAALGEMKPVSGNWCWISETRPDLRYGLAHGWRYAIILATVCIYAYTYQYLSRHFRSLVIPAVLTRRTHQEQRDCSQRSWPETAHDHDIPLAPRRGNNTSAMQPFEGRYQHPGVYTADSSVSEENSSRYPRDQKQGGPSVTSSTTPKYSGGRARRGRDSAETEIKRMLLLNGYPVMYIVLWIPGLTNRILEASGRPSSSEVLAALQCSTQFVGFANAVTYGLNREMRQVLGRDLGRLLWGRKASAEGLELA